MDRRLVVLIAMLGACDPDDPRHGTQIGDEGNSEDFGCVEISREAIADPTVPAAGFGASPDAMWERLHGRFAGELMLDAGGAVDLTLALESAGEWELVRQEEREYTGGEEPNIYIECPDAYERTARVTLVADGHFDEVLEARVRVPDSGGSSWSASIALEDIVGPARPSRIDPAAMDRVWLDIGGYDVIGNPGWSGGMAFLGEASSGKGPDSAVSLTNDPYGEFAVGPAE